MHDSAHFLSAKPKRQYPCRPVKLRSKAEVKLGVPLSSPSAEWRLPRLDEIPALTTASAAFWQRGLFWLLLAFGLILHFAPLGRQTPLQELAEAVKVILLCGGASAAILALLGKASNDRSAGMSLSAVKTRLPVESACPIFIRIFQEETVTGTDEGYLWLDEETLYFKGTQCAFRVNSNDVAPLSEWQKGHRPKSDDGAGLRWLELRGASRPLKLQFSFLELDGDHASHRRASQMVRALMSWINRGEEGALETVLPPLAVHPGLLPDKWSSEGWISGLVIGLTGALLGGSAILRLAAPGHLGVSATEVLITLTGFAMTFFGVRFSASQYRDRQLRTALAIEHELAL